MLGPCAICKNRAGPGIALPWWATGKVWRACMSCAKDIQLLTDVEVRAMLDKAERARRKAQGK